MLRKIDVFGYPIQFNFNGETELKSTFGGFVSIFAISSWIIFFVLVTLRFILPSYQATSHNMISKYTEPADMTTPLNYTSNGLKLYATVTKGNGVWDRRDLRRFINVQFSYGNDENK